MGSTRWDEVTATSYVHAENLRSTGRLTRMAYSADVQAGRVARKVHDQMNPRGVTRECRDSAVHPEAVPVMVFLDVTGSMRSVPGVLQSRLGRLMTLLQDRGYMEHPAILIGAIGDAVSDDGPLQVGQFESGIEIDHDLERLWLEGGGGGSMQESYELAHYFAARHTQSDHWDRRQQKGFLFTIGDEAPYPFVSARAAQAIVGDALGQDIPLIDIVREAQQRYHVFHLHAQQGQYRGNDGILNQWRSVVGADHVILLENANNVAEVIALVIGIVNGRLSLEDARRHLTQVGLAAADVEGLVQSVNALAERAIRLRDEVAG